MLGTFINCSTLVTFSGSLDASSSTPKIISSVSSTLRRKTEKYH